MQGTLLYALGHYMQKTFGSPVWQQVLKEAGAPGSGYLPTRDYPGSSPAALAEAATRVTGIPAAQVLDGFGRFAIPMLLRMYGAALDPRWKTLDVLERTETLMHGTVRQRTPSAHPPRLGIRRPSADEVVIAYTSPRRLCALGVGLIHGIAQTRGEVVTVEHRRCLHRGDSCCELHVRVS